VCTRDDSGKNNNCCSLEAFMGEDESGIGLCSKHCSLEAFMGEDESGIGLCSKHWDQVFGKAKPGDATERKSKPLATGVLDYFPLALEAVATCSRVGNEQHNPGRPLHWAKDKSTDHADALMRHLIDRGKLDTDGVLHSAKVAWRALALLQTELEKAQKTGAK
jgi:hypothetical protein